MKDLNEKKISSINIYKGTLLNVKKDIVLLPNGKKGTREWVKHPGAVCCIPILPNGEIGLIRQFRYPVKKEMIEIPAGKLDKNEKPENGVIRELEEEIGFKAKKITFLTTIYPAIGFSNEKMWIYLAEDLFKTKVKLDADEFLELIPTPLKEAINMIWLGKITDVKTIIGLLWVERLFKIKTDTIK